MRAEHEIERLMARDDSFEDVVFEFGVVQIDHAGAITFDDESRIVDPLSLIRGQGEGVA
jgi:hypothetical protein